jgi:hypothetical protein
MTSTGWAEVKPEGALLPTFCGDNLAESTEENSEVDRFWAPEAICLWTVNGMNPENQRPIFSTEINGRLTFYSVLGRFQIMQGLEIWQGYQLNSYQSGNFHYLSVGVDLQQPMVELQYSNPVAVSRAPQLTGESINVVLEPVLASQ